MPGGRSTSFDLSEVAPSRDALALRVSVSRGRLASHVVDVVDPVGRDRPVREWLPAQAAPASTSYVAGIGTDRRRPGPHPGQPRRQRGAGRRSSWSARTASSRPSGLEEVTLAPASVSEVDLSGVLRGRGLAGVQALRLEATGPVTASLRTRTPTDLALTPAGPTIDSARPPSPCPPEPSASWSRAPPPRAS